MNRGGTSGAADPGEDRLRGELLRNALYRIIEKAAVAEDLPQLYAFLHDVVGELLNAENFYVAIYDPATELLSFPYFKDRFDPAPPPTRLGRGVTEIVLATGEPLLCPSELFESWAESGKVQLVGAPSIDWLGVPLKSGGVTFGVLAVQSYDSSVRYGANEKEILAIVGRQIEGAVKRKSAEADLRESEERFRLLANSTFEGIVLHEDGVILEANMAFAEIAGRTVDALSGTPVLDLVSPSQRERIRESIKNPEDTAYETEMQRPDGSFVAVEVQAKSIKFKDRTVRVTAVRDLTERRKLEGQLRQAQKMEAIGRLAGGVAHDFNNLLTTILGFSDLVIAELPEESEVRADATEIRRAAERAAALTRQLLAFSRKQILSPQLLDLNSAVEGLQKMLRRLIGEDINLVTRLQPGLGLVRADPGQIEQLVVNLAVNARDAMPEGGTLAIETSRAQDRALPGGPHILLAVRDTGLGIGPDVKSHLFEPFFTTKDTGKGTGLGLATVYSVVKQAGGEIQVESEPGRGTLFSIFLPEVEANRAAPPADSLDMSPSHLITQEIRRTVLLAEDEPTVRALARRVLEEAGYKVLEARDGQDALRIAALWGHIDLLVTDLVMPGLSGQALAARLQSQHPRLKVLFISGYTDDVNIRQVIAASEVAFLPKPFSPDTLREKVREALARPRTPSVDPKLSVQDASERLRPS